MTERVEVKAPFKSFYELSMTDRMDPNKIKQLMEKQDEHKTSNS